MPFFDVASYVARTKRKAPLPSQAVTLMSYIVCYILLKKLVVVVYRTVSSHPCGKHRHLILDSLWREPGKGRCMVKRLSKHVAYAVYACSGGQGYLHEALDCRLEGQRFVDLADLGNLLQVEIGLLVGYKGKQLCLFIIGGVLLDDGGSV